MSDLRRHALEEYNELYARELTQQCQSTQANCTDFYESKNKKKKNRKKQKKTETEEIQPVAQSTER